MHYWRAAATPDTGDSNTGTSTAPPTATTNRPNCPARLLTLEPRPLRTTIVYERDGQPVDRGYYIHRYFDTILVWICAKDSREQQVGRESRRHSSQPTLSYDINRKYRLCKRRQRSEEFVVAATRGRCRHRTAWEVAPLLR